VSTQDWGKNGPLSRAIREQAGLAEVRKEASTNVAARILRLGERDLPRPVPGCNEGQREVFKRRNVDRLAGEIHDDLLGEGAVRKTLSRDQVKSMYGTEIEVRKDDAGGARAQARALIEKAADALPGDEVDPVQVQTGAQRMLFETFRKAADRDPGAKDSGYWQAYAHIIEAIKSEMDRQAA
jgi:hypothetical protein